jgi:outer membrane biogenesis lipoprotein LolB
MKSLFVAFLLTFFSLFLSGCTSNASLENTQEYDSDDIDVIGTI